MTLTEGFIVPMWCSTSYVDKNSTQVEVRHWQRVERKTFNFPANEGLPPDAWAWAQSTKLQFIKEAETLSRITARLTR